MLSTESKATYWLPAKRVSAVGPDAMTVQESEAITQSPPPAEAIVLSEVLKRKVVTEGGTLVGQIASLEYDAQGMSVVGVEVSAGVFKSNTTIQPAEIVSVGDELIIVRDSVLSGEATQRPEDAAPEYRFLSGEVKAPEAKAAEVKRVEATLVDDRSGGVEPNDVDPTASRAKRT